MFKWVVSTSGRIHVLGDLYLEKGLWATRGGESDKGCACRAHVLCSVMSGKGTWASASTGARWILAAASRGMLVDSNSLKGSI